MRVADLPLWSFMSSNFYFLTPSSLVPCVWEAKGVIEQAGHRMGMGTANKRMNTCRSYLGLRIHWPLESEEMVQTMGVGWEERHG